MPAWARPSAACKLRQSSAPPPPSPVIAALMRAASEARQGRRVQPFCPGSSPGQGFASSPMLRALEFSDVGPPSPGSYADDAEDGSSLDPMLQFPSSVSAIDAATRRGDASAGASRNRAQKVQRSPLTPLSMNSGFRASGVSHKRLISHQWCDENLAAKSAGRSVISNLCTELDAAAKPAEGDVRQLPLANCWPQKSNGGQGSLRTLRSPPKTTQHGQGVMLAAAEAEIGEQSEVLAWLSVNPGSETVAVRLTSVML